MHTSPFWMTTFGAGISLFCLFKLISRKSDVSLIAIVWLSDRSMPLPTAEASWETPCILAEF